jgi:hypothetical protein
MLAELPHSDKFCYLSIQKNTRNHKIYVVRHRQSSNNYTLTHYDNIFSDSANAYDTLRDLTIFRKGDHPNVKRSSGIIVPANPEEFTDIFVVSDYNPFLLN